MSKKLPKTNILARQSFHIVANIAAGVFVLLSTPELIKYVAASLFGIIFIFEFIRINTSARTAVIETMGPLFKKKEFFEASGLFWLSIAGLIAVLFASPLAVGYGFFVLALADPAASTGGTKIKSRKLYRRKTLAGFLSFLAVAVVLSILFAMMFTTFSVAFPLGLIFGFGLAMIEMYSYPFDDNFTILLFASALMELAIRLL